MGRNKVVPSPRFGFPAPGDRILDYLGRVRLNLNFACGKAIWFSQVLLGGSYLIVNKQLDDVAVRGSLVGAVPAGKGLGGGAGRTAQPDAEQTNAGSSTPRLFCPWDFHTTFRPAVDATFSSGRG